MARASFGLILANRAVVLGAIQARDLIELSQQAETSGAFDTLWVGDSLLAKPRLEAVALLAALAGATSRLKLAVGCLATFVTDTVPGDNSASELPFEIVQGSLVVRRDEDLRPRMSLEKALHIRAVPGEHQGALAVRTDLLF